MKYGIAFVWVLCLSAAAAADEVKLKSGRVVEGIARQEPGQVVVETGLGTLTFPADQVSSIVPGRTALHEYQERIAALGQGPQVDAVFETALWARDHHLTRYVNTLLQWTLAIDPDHPQARKMLDYVKYEGRWIPSRERDELAATRVQKAHGEAERGQRLYARHSRPQPEISPGYVYFGIPPSLPPRGSQNHGYGSDNYSFAYPYSMSASGGSGIFMGGGGSPGITPQY